MRLLRYAARGEFHIKYKQTLEKLRPDTREKARLRWQATGGRRRQAGGCSSFCFILVLCLSLKLGQLFQLLLHRLFDYRFKFVVLVHTAAGVAAPAPAPTPLQLVFFQICSQHFRLISNHVCACLTCSEAWKAAEIQGKLLSKRL